MMRKILLLVCCIVASHAVFADAITYTRKDSIKVVTLLKQGQEEADSATNLMLYYGEKLKDVPYIAHTLEVNKREQLVVNLRQLDCTTFVETVFALALTHKEGSARWADYCRNLKRLRYDAGVMNGYPSRNHYFYWWMESNRKQGLVTLPMDEALALKSTPKYAYARTQTININYMSAHASAYKMLNGNKADIASISKHEKATAGKTIRYIPAAYVGRSRKQLRYVNDGDILALAASPRKKGLDTTHIGIAKWGRDGKLHLLNAPQVHKKVVMEPMTLEAYMKKHPSQMGVWVLRPVL